MSYILEALKKSENDRGETGTPTFQTVHHSSLQYQSQRQSMWPYILTAIVVINMAVLAYLVYDSGKQPVVVAQAAPAIPATVAATPVYSNTAQPQLVAPQQAQPATQPAAQAPALAASRPTTPATVITEPQPAWQAPVQATAAPAPQDNTETVALSVNELPFDMQASIPDMAFSAHVYSSNPRQRSVVINGNFMEEGDLLTSQLRLMEITTDGVVFDYQGTLFRSSVVSGWTIN